MNLYGERIKAIEDHLKNLSFPSEPSQLYDPIRYFISLGGKRIRPLFTLLCSELFQVSQNESLPAACSLELFHNFTLIHDDIMDNAPVRRGLATVHEKWNPNVAILSGDVLMIHAFEELTPYEGDIYKELTRLLNTTSKEVCMGQQMDMDFEKQTHVSEEEYLEMIRLKTSVLLGCACSFGGILGATTEENIHYLYQFGESLGLAFQIQDDILDAFGDSDRVGKQMGGDILSDKKTLLFTAFQSHASEKDKLAFDHFSSLNGRAKIEGIKNLYQKTGVLDYCAQKQSKYSENALFHLEKVQSHDDKHLLMELANFITSRSH